MSKESRARLVIRNATDADVLAIQKLSNKVYTKEHAYHQAAIRGQINHFPEGQFVALYDGQAVGYCSSMIIDEKRAFMPHNWRQITGNGYCSTHDPDGDYLYGVDIFVDPDFRRMRIGERFYKERKKLCTHLGLKGIVFAGRMPLLRKRFTRVGSVDEYLRQVLDKKIRDPVLNFQLKEGFEILGILENYLPYDYESMGYACHMVWSNPSVEAEDRAATSTGLLLPKTVRIASVQYKQRSIKSFEEFESIVNYFVGVCSDYHADFCLFPEMFTLQLLSIENSKLSPEKAILQLTEYTSKIKSLFKELAVKNNIHIIAGSHPTRIQTDLVQNISYVFLRDGSIYEQPKIHPTPDERYWWNISGGDELNAIATDCGSIGVLICYDSEFPELARHLVDQGANILFVPFCTSERQSYLRVRYCCQARAVENQCYVVMSGNVGNLPRVENMDIQYGQSCILTPCDFCFSRDGIAADSTPNCEQVILADLRYENLFKSRHSGTVINLRDRRHDLFSVVWHKKL
jgi:predicted amidohydrolase/GNAT superfamily N-acetyltransferase